MPYAIVEFIMLNTSILLAGISNQNSKFALSQAPLKVSNFKP